MSPVILAFQYYGMKHTKLAQDPLRSSPIMLPLSQPCYPFELAGAPFPILHKSVII